MKILSEIELSKISGGSSVAPTVPQASWPASSPFINFDAAFRTLMQWLPFAGSTARLD